MSDFNVDPVEIRKNIWRAARGHYRNFGQALDLTNLQVKVSKPGLIVFADKRPAYCDGCAHRAHPQHVYTELVTKRKIVFLQLLDEPSDQELEPITTKKWAIV